ncbi:alpha/beta hydrolase [Streptomyces silvisoli]|uniref:Alpha/beta hydrolase-fold protein n=1 Tax=Streptomyces silvisoli TaxID=3034235 RepID=A0ABT5ZR94_9ACTN|nr:alpha/beta hydrolase-fold protein [Streptomyces silvisoli]MDF3292176.1 alpha/beta hydrolase-fold protein [Streptomyces silvisoli]
MGLTSKKLLVLVIVLAVAFFVATIWLWPRLSRQGVKPIAGRVGLLFGGQLAILAALGLSINSYFGFYSSFADLFGTNQDPGQVVDYTAGATNGKDGLEHLGSQGVGVPGGGSPDKAGRIDKVQIKGAKTGITTPAYVYLPPQYFQKGFSKQNFPASVILTGYPGTAESLITRMKYPQTATEHIQQGKMQPMIMVMMRPTVVPPRDTECMDVPGGPQVETFFTKELRQVISANYRVGNAPQNWGVMGDSTGGYCALKMSMRHPDAFSAAVSLSGYYNTHNDPTTGDLFGGSKQLQNENDMMWLLKNKPAPKVWALVTSSKQGEWDYSRTVAFMKAVKPPMQIASIILPSGGHNFTTWNREVPSALDALSQHLTQ